MQRLGYWLSPVLVDPWGQPYRCRSARGGFRVWSTGPDGEDGTGDELESRRASPEPTAAAVPARPATPRPAPPPLTRRKVGNTLTVTKSGNDLVLSWDPTGTVYDVVGSATPGFQNPYYLSHQTGTTFTYSGVLAGGQSVAFFDVSDENETNRGEDGAGNLPPPPPLLDPIPGGTAFTIGATATLTGSGFSEVPGDNLVCWAGGICQHPETATSTQLELVVPPSALTSPVTVTIGGLQSEPTQAEVRLHPSALSTLRSVGFSEQAGEYWATGTDGTGDHFFRHYWEPSTGTWTRATADGTFTGLHYLSTTTDRFGTFYAGYATTPSTTGGTRRVVPPSGALPCTTLDPPGSNNQIRVLGAAPDPNPNGEAGRDVVYFALADATAGTERIYKVNVSASECLGVADSDFGNRNGIWDWTNPWPVGMAVDGATGELYVSEKTKVSVVDPVTEAVTTFNTQFQRIYGLDVWHEPDTGSDFGLLLVADNQANAVKLVPLDNPTATPVTVATGSLVRTVAFALSTFSTVAWDPAELNRLTFVSNTGGLAALRPAPGLSTDPWSSITRVWISSPDPDAMDFGDPSQSQVVVRRALDPPADEYSTFRVKAWWDDGKDRELCAMLGDPPTSAPYDPTPTDPNCGKPWYDPLTRLPNGRCDNHEQFNAAAGVGTSVGSGEIHECKAGCGAAWQLPCEFEFRVTQRYAGDNYRVYLYEPDGKDIFGSAIVTAWKRPYVEYDRMCRVGGMVYADPDRDPDAWAGDTVVLVGKERVVPPAPDPVRWDRRDNLQLDQRVHIFDTVNTYEGAHDVAYVCQVGMDDPDLPYIAVALSTVAGVNCPSNPYYLQHSYNGSVPTPPTPPEHPLPVWDFDWARLPGSTHPGLGGGLCAEGADPAGDLFEANPSLLNRRDRAGTFDDAFTAFRLAPGGAGIVPYLPEEWFLAHVPVQPPVPRDIGLFSQLWFENKVPGSPPDLHHLNYPHNYFHLVGVSSSGWAGLSGGAGDWSLSFVGKIETDCRDLIQWPDLPSCTYNYVAQNACHELAHQLWVNTEGECVDDPDDILGHDPGAGSQLSNVAWCSGLTGCTNPVLGEARCLMSGASDLPALRQRADEVNRMECEDLGSFDPHPPGSAPDPCALDDCGWGVRNQEDPQ